MPNSKAAGFAAFRYAKIAYKILDIETLKHDPELDAFRKTHQNILNELKLTSREINALQGSVSDSLSRIEKSRIGIAKSTHNGLQLVEDEHHAKIQDALKTKPFYEKALRAASEDLSKLGVHVAGQHFNISSSLGHIEHAVGKPEADTILRILEQVRDKFNLPENALYATKHFNSNKTVTSINFPRNTDGNIYAFEVLKLIAAQNDGKSMEVLHNGVDLLDLATKYKGFLEAVKGEGKTLENSFYENSDFSFDYKYSYDRDGFEWHLANLNNPTELENLQIQQTMAHYFIEDHSEQFGNMYQRWESTALENKEDFSFNR